MQFVYKPEGVEPLTWEFNPGKLMSPEVEAIERYTGQAFGDWVEQLERGSFTAIHGLLYVLLKRTRPTLKWNEVEFCMDEVGWDLSPEDMAAMVENLEAKAKTEGLTDREAEQLAELREELAAAPLEQPEQ